MARINPLDPANASAEVKATLDAVKTKLGSVPNLFLTFAVAPSVLNGYLALSGAAEAGALPARVREQIALVAAGANTCDYCASAHEVLGKMAGLSPEDIARAYKADAADAKARAALQFARRIIDLRGKVTDGDLQAVKSAGYTDGEVLEIVSNVALNIFTNYFNHVAGTEIDFPAVNSAAKAA